MKLAPQYSWLREAKAPRMIVEAMKLYGVTETPGPLNNPTIMSWAKEVDVKGYTRDEIPWCGLFMAVVAKRAGKPLPGTPLWARAWAQWGKKSSTPMLGDVLVFTRVGGGHVALYVGEDKTHFHCLGGNQTDAVTVTRIVKHRLLAARNLYNVKAPPEVRQIFYDGGGAVSTNEA